MDEKRVKEVFSDESFVKGLMEKETSEDVQAALKEKGLDFSLEEIAKIRDGIVSGVANGDELAMDQLEDVAGGFVIATVIGIVCSIIGATAGLAGMTHTVSNRRW